MEEVMMNHDSDSALDREIFDQVGQIISAVEQLLVTENRPADLYTSMRYKILEVAEQLWSVRECYFGTIISQGGVDAKEDSVYEVLFGNRSEE